MANKYLTREDAPFGVDTWKILDQTMVEAAKSQLVGRRLLHLQGPYGLGLKSVALSDERSDTGVVIGKTLPLQYIHRTFSLTARDLAAYEREGLYLDVRTVAETAMEYARLEDDLLFRGTPDTPGLLKVQGATRVSLSPWDATGDAMDNLIEAVTALDAAGFHGPYALALAPDRYNLLFHRYQNGNQTEMEHVRMLITDGVYKAPIWRAVECSSPRVCSTRPSSSGRT